MPESDKEEGLIKGAECENWSWNGVAG